MPGETPDHMLVWLPNQQLLFSADNYYHAFPNFYLIRGSVYRDFGLWADNLDAMRALEPKVLAPGHSQPLLGREKISQRLQDYSAAIRFVIETTVNGLNAGQSPDEIVEGLTLPDHLAHKPYLREFYGRLDWSVRAYAAGTIGWFDGNPTNLGRLSPKEEANRMIALAGGADAILDAANSSDEPQWILELTDRLIAAQQHLEQAKTLKARALRHLADQQINATARNFYLVSANDLEASE